MKQVKLLQSKQNKNNKKIKNEILFKQKKKIEH